MARRYEEPSRTEVCPVEAELYLCPGYGALDDLESPHQVSRDRGTVTNVHGDVVRLGHSVLREVVWLEDGVHSDDLDVCQEKKTRYTEEQ